MTAVAKEVGVFTLERYPDKETWLAAHKGGVGSSTASAVMGENKWRSPYHAWAEHSGLLAPSEEESEASLWGQLLEPIVADEWARRTERQIIDHGRFTMARNIEHPILLSTIDREITSLTEGPGILEVKTTSNWNDSEWAEEPPTQYQIQLQHQLLTTGYTWGVLVCLIGGQKMKWWKTERNDVYLKSHLDAMYDFMRRVRDNDPPEVDGSERTATALRRLYTEDPTKTVVFPAEIIDADTQIVRIDERVKALETEGVRLRNLVRQSLGEAVVGLLPGGAKWTHRSSKAGVKALRRSAK